MEDEEFKIPFITVKEIVDYNHSTSLKPQYKLKISELLEIPFDEEKNHFTFKDKSVNLVMFGGKIENIYRDDTLFSFRVNDGTGSIQCFHKYKEDTNLLVDKMKQLLNSKSYLLEESLSRTESEEVTMFNNTAEDTILNSYDKESEEIMKEVLLWFTNEVINKQKIKDIEDIIHVSGHLCESESVRKVKVIDFRIVENIEEHQDFLLELDYLYKHLY